MSDEEIIFHHTVNTHIKKLRIKNLQAEIWSIKHLMYKNHFSLTNEGGSYTKNYKRLENTGADPSMCAGPLEIHSRVQKVDPDFHLLTTSVNAKYYY